MQQKPLLNIEHLSIHFPSQTQAVVDDLSLQLYPQQTLALIGESGSGKSLTALAIMQLLPSDALISPQAIIAFEQNNLLTKAECELRHIRGAAMAMIFQEPMTSLNPVMTIGAQINEVLKLHTTLSSKQRALHIQQLLTEVGIADARIRMRQYPHQLSGGLKQRVMIAMMIAARPKLLIADEPTTALDVTVQAEILLLLKKCQQKYGMSILLITHDLGVARFMAHDVAIMQQGKLLERNRADTFFLQPQHPYSCKLLTLALADIPSAIKSNHAMPPLLAVEQLSVRFPLSRQWFWQTKRYLSAVTQVSFTLARGQCLALVGESGCGKSTLARAVMQLIAYQSGTIQWDNRLVQTKHDLHWYRQRVQMIFQDAAYAMNPRWRIRDILLEGVKALGLIKTPLQQQQQVEHLLSLMELPLEFADRYVHECSGGQRQRLGIARALAVKPELLICDEPTSALDMSTQQQILTLLQNLQHTQRLSYLLITHNMAVVAQMADHVIVMYLGQIVERGRVEEILQTPQHPYTQALMASIPSVRGQHALLGIQGDLPSPLNVPQGCRYHPRCPHAQSRCQQTSPEQQILSASHAVACHRVGEF